MKVFYSINSFFVCLFLILTFSHVQPADTKGQNEPPKADTVNAKKATTNALLPIYRIKQINDSAQASIAISDAATQRQMSVMQKLKSDLYRYSKKKDQKEIVYIDIATGKIVDPKHYRHSEVKDSGPASIKCFDFEDPEPIPEAKPPEKKRTAIGRFFNRIFGKK